MTVSRQATPSLLHDFRTCARVVVVDVLQCDFSGMLVAWTGSTLMIMATDTSIAMSIALVWLTGSCTLSGRTRTRLQTRSTRRCKPVRPGCGRCGSP